MEMCGILNFEVQKLSKKFKYNGEEKLKNKELDILMDEWISELSKNPEPISNGDKTKTTPSDCFAKDGFFPEYYEQKRKVVFICRETRLIGGYDFRDTTKEFFENDFNNNNSFWRHILYIMYGIKTEGKYSFEEIPTALEIQNEMYSNNNFGFATINISKYSNDDKNNWQTNIVLANRFLKDSNLDKTNFFQKELELLNPDIIITANLWEHVLFNEEYLDLCLPKTNFSKGKNVIYDGESVAEYGKYNLNGRDIDYIDLYHFSAKKSDKYCYYNPVMKILFPKK